MICIQPTLPPKPGLNMPSAMQSYNSHLLRALTQVEYWRYRRLALIASLLLLEATAFLTLSLLSKENPLLQTWQVGQPVTSIDFSPDGKLLALGTQNGLVQVRQVTSGTLLYTRSGLGPLTFSPDGKVLISGARNGSLQVWNASNGTLVHTLSGNGYMPDALAFSPKGTVLASLSLDFSGDPRDVVRLWDMSDWQLTKTLNLKVSPFFSPKGIAFADDGQTLLVGSTGGHIHSWHL